MDKFNWLLLFINRDPEIKGNGIDYSQVPAFCPATPFPNFLRMCGTFAYINFLTEKKRSEILEILLNGLSRLEYRGYDSAGTAVFS